MGLWLYATLEGVGTARTLEGLCRQHDAYRWLCGGVSVNYHTLADFRVAHGAFLDHQLTVGVATLMSEGLVTMKRVAQDGVRIRASAGAASLRRQPTLESCLEEARTQVEALRKELQDDPAASSQRERAARLRAAEEREQRVQKALEQAPQVEARKKAKARVSTADPQARVMKMADGGFRPAFNGQFCTDTETRIVVGVDLSNDGSDQGELVPMLEQLAERYQGLPEETLVDGGFANKQAIEAATTAGTTVYAPVQKPKDPTCDPHAALAEDSPAVAAWRERMGRQPAKDLYKQRAATAECVNALARNRGLRQFTVRGLREVKTVLLRYALAHNLMRAAFLRRQSARYAPT
jgi:hypothetical protein